MADVVRVGEQRLIGEILTMNGDSASIQVYEETSGLGPGAEVETTGAPLSVELGPGLIENIYDGIQRPLEVIMKKAGSNNLPRGVEVPALDREKKWDFTPVVQAGRPGGGRRRHRHRAGDRLDPPQDHDAPQDEGHHRLHPVRRLHRAPRRWPCWRQEDGSQVELPMMQKWPVRVGRPYKHKYPPTIPLPVRPAHRGHLLPRGQGRHRRHPRPLRLGQDGDAARPGQVVRRGHRGLHRLRRAGQRDDRRAAGVPRAGGPPHRRVPDEAHRAHRQHLRHAGGRP